MYVIHSYTHSIHRGDYHLSAMLAGLMVSITMTVEFSPSCREVALAKVIPSSFTGGRSISTSRGPVAWRTDSSTLTSYSIVSTVNLESHWWRIVWASAKVAQCTDCPSTATRRSPLFKEPSLKQSNYITLPLLPCSKESLWVNLTHIPETKNNIGYISVKNKYRICVTL